VSLYDDPKKWAELAARLYDEKAEKPTRSAARANLASRRGAENSSGRGGLVSLPPAALPTPVAPPREDEEATQPLPELDPAGEVPVESAEDDPTDVRVPGVDRPRGTLDEPFEPAPGECAAHLIDEDAAGAAHAIPPDCTGFTIGRARVCELQVRVDGEISRKHARITRRRDRFIIEDLDSRNGTLVNGELVESRRLFGGELIQVGLSRFRFVLFDA